MKNKVFYGIIVMAIVSVATFNLRLRSEISGLSDVMLANIQALAENEMGTEGDINSCYMGTAYNPTYKPYSKQIKACGNACNPVSATQWTGPIEESLCK